MAIQRMQTSWWRRRHNVQRIAIVGVWTCLAALTIWIRPSLVLQQAVRGPRKSHALVSSSKLDQGEEAAFACLEQGLFSANATETTVAGSHVVLTVTGQKGGTVNQDRAAMWPCRSATSMAVAAVLFDGHGGGGEVCAQTALQIVPTAVVRTYNVASSSASDSERMQDAVGQAFAKADASMGICQSAGTTALLLLLHDIAPDQASRKVTLASAGDSTGLIVQFIPPANDKETGAVVLAAESVKHKPGNPEERTRIEAVGGTVWMPGNADRNDTASSRVLYPTTEGEMSLAMSRSLGDMDGKSFGVLTSEPALVTVTIPAGTTNENDDKSLWFAILASDGVLDVLDKHYVSNTVAAVLTDPTALDMACRNLLQEAKVAWFKWTAGQYRDDMTMLVTRLY